MVKGYQKNAPLQPVQDLDETVAAGGHREPLHSRKQQAAYKFPFFER